MRHTMPAGALVLVCLLGCQGKNHEPGPDATGGAGPARPNILVVDIDSLRADFLSPAACEAGLAPAICGRAAGGTWFTQAFSQSGWTMPAVDALLTGRYPSEASFDIRRKDQLEDDAHAAQLQQARRGPYAPPSMPEVLALYDYDTHVFWGSSAARLAPFLSEGFVHVDRIDPPNSPLEWREPVQAWLQETPVEPFFALFHSLDVHWGLPSHEVSLASSQLPPPNCEGILGLNMDQVYGELSADTSPESAFAALRLCYEDRVRWHDAQVGWILDELEQQGLLERTLVVITSNHGEGLSSRLPGVHGPLYSETLHVPLLWIEPGTKRGGRKVETSVQLMDLAPSLLERVGATLPAELDGRSLLPLMGGTGAPYEPRELFAISSWKTQAVRDAEHFLVRSFRRRRGILSQRAPVLELYHIDDDPRELTDLSGAMPHKAQQLNQQLDVWALELQARSSPQQGHGLDPSAVRQLRERGYWGDFDLPAQKDQ